MRQKSRFHLYDLNFAMLFTYFFSFNYCIFCNLYIFLKKYRGFEKFSEIPYKSYLSLSLAVSSSSSICFVICVFEVCKTFLQIV